MFVVPLTDLEKAVLLKKAGIAQSLMEGYDIDLKEMSGAYDASKSPAGEWDKTHTYDRTPGAGYRGVNTVYRPTLSGRGFVILVIERGYSIDSDVAEYHHEEVRRYGSCRCCGVFHYVFHSEGSKLDALRVGYGKLLGLLKRANRHLPEALDELREEAALIQEGIAEASTV